jgi:hypothetical protein
MYLQRPLSAQRAVFLVKNPSPGSFLREKARGGAFLRGKWNGEVTIFGMASADKKQLLLLPFRN